jgi:uncharacterized membrane protein YedE/YeeE
LHLLDLQDLQEISMGMSWQFAHPFVQAAIGGVMIGLASWLLLASLGRIAGISGIAASALVPAKHAAEGETAWRWAFMAGLIGVGALASNYMHVPVVAARPYSLLILGGVLVGFGTVLGSGCTSGHGVCGIGRRSVRSLVATMVFMGAGVATVFIAHLAYNTPAGG